MRQKQYCLQLLQHRLTKTNIFRYSNYPWTGHQSTALSTNLYSLGFYSTCFEISAVFFHQQTLKKWKFIIQKKQKELMYHALSFILKFLFMMSCWLFNKISKKNLVQYSKNIENKINITFFTQYHLFTRYIA